MLQSDFLRNGLTLGLDTSNYTCSAALYSPADGKVVQAKQLLPVKSGEKGVRQSDAVFHHTVLLPQMIERLGGEISEVSAVGVSDRPSCREGSYMPCFLVGVGTARAICAAKKIPIFKTTHQIGHILAALCSADRLDLAEREERFIALHISGGTTDLLLCEPDENSLLRITRIGGSDDLKAGQAIDRCGVMLGLDFPCGAQLEKLAEESYGGVKARATAKGTHCSLSGVENKFRKLYDDGAEASYIAAFCLKTIELSVAAIIEAALAEYGDIPVLCAGGVMSDKLIAERIKKRFGAHFAAPEFSCDNAAGTAIFAALAREKGLI